MAGEEKRTMHAVSFNTWWVKQTCGRAALILKLMIGRERGGKDAAAKSRHARHHGPVGQPMVDRAEDERTRTYLCSTHRKIMASFDPILLAWFVHALTRSERSSRPRRSRAKLDWILFSVGSLLFWCLEMINKQVIFSSRFRFGCGHVCTMAPSRSRITSQPQNELNVALGC